MERGTPTLAAVASLEPPLRKWLSDARNGEVEGTEWRLSRPDQGPYQKGIDKAKAGQMS